MKKFCAILLVLCSLAYPPTTVWAEQPEVFADSAILMDAKTGTVLYKKNAEKQQFPASITKIMTTLLAIEYGKYEEVLTFSHNAVFSIERGSSHIGMDVGEQITLDQGLYGIMLMSANEVSNAVAEMIDGSVEEFAVHMNAKAKELGAYHTNFVNSHGLPDENHYTTAYDMALIAKAAIQYDKFRELIGTLIYTIPPTNIQAKSRDLANQHQMIKNTQYYYEDAEGGKTGWTTASGHTLVTFAKRGDLELIAVILKSDRANMYLDTIKLFDYGFDNFSYQTVFEKSTYSDTVPIIQKQDTNTIDIGIAEVVAENDFIALLPKEAIPAQIVKKIYLPYTLNTPVSPNQAVGSIAFFYLNEKLGEVPLLSKQGFEVMEPVLSTEIEEVERSSWIAIWKPIGIIAGVIIGIIGLLFIYCLLLYHIRKKRRKIKRNKLRFSSKYK